MSDRSLQLADLEIGPSATAWSEAFPAFQHDAAYAALEAASSDAGAMTLAITLEVAYSPQGPWFDALAADTALAGGLDLAAVASPAEVAATVSDLGAAPYLRFKVVNSIAHTVTATFSVGLGLSKGDRHFGAPHTEPALFDRLHHGKVETFDFTAAADVIMSEALWVGDFDDIALFIEGDAALAGTAQLLISADRDGPWEVVAIAGSDLSTSLAFEPAKVPGANYVKVKLLQTAAAAGSVKVSLFGR